MSSTPVQQITSDLPEDAWRILEARGCPRRQPGGGMDFFWVAPTATKMSRESLSRQYPGLHIPEGGYGLGIRYQETQDGIPRARVRLHEAIEREDGRRQRYCSQQRGPNLPHPTVPWICPQVAQTLRAHQPVDPATLASLPTTTPQRIVITEAPLKSWCLTANQIPSIGLGGVAAGGLDPTQTLLTLHPELRQYDWESREVVILFDANIHTKWEVALEAAKLARAFKTSGATVKIAFLPRELESAGPDDYLVSFGADSLLAIIESAEAANPLDAGLTPDAISQSLYFRAALQVGGDLMIAELNKRHGKPGIAAIRTLATKPEKTTHEKALFERGDHSELALYLIRQLSQETDGRTVPPVYAEGSFYKYEPGYGTWELIPDEQLSRSIQQLSGSIVSGGQELRIQNTTVRGTIELMRDRVRVDRFFEDARRDGCCMANGFARLTADGVSMEPHSPSNRQRHRYAVQYVPNLTPSRFLGMLEYAFRGDVDAADKIQCVREFVGVSRIGAATRYQRALIAYGPTANNGKSEILAAINKSFPRDTVASLSPWDIGDRFRLAELVGRLVNVSDDDRGTQAMQYAGLYKEMVTASSPKPYERKNKGHEMFLPVAGHILGVNSLPRADDKTNGWYRRQIVLVFNHPVESDKLIRAIHEQVIAEELQQLVCWTLDGACQVIKSGSYTVPVSSDEAVRDWRKNSDPAYAFAVEACKESIEAETKADDLWTSFKLYCVREDIEHRMGKRVFLERLKPWYHRTSESRHYHLTIADTGAPEETANATDTSDQYDYLLGEV